MDRSEFVKYEFLSIREEIKETKTRIFRLAGLGLVAMPSAYFLAQTYELDVLIISLPFLISTVVLLYLSESRALMRCGAYIKQVIESEVRNTDGDRIFGWEHWLSEKPKGEPDRRLVDKLVAIFFYLLFLFYYVASVSLAVAKASELFGIIGLSVVLAFYIGIGIMFLAFLIMNYRYSTST